MFGLVVLPKISLESEAENFLHILIKIFILFKAPSPSQSKLDSKFRYVLNNQEVFRRCRETSTHFQIFESHDSRIYDCQETEINLVFTDSPRT